MRLHTASIYETEINDQGEYSMKEHIALTTSATARTFALLFFQIFLSTFRKDVVVLFTGSLAYRRARVTVQRTSTK